jgi:hypothetical protein
MGPMVKRQLSADQILATGLRNQWYAICPSDMVPQGGVHRVRRLGIDWVLFRESDGTLRMLEDRCPHRGAPLVRRAVAAGRTVGGLLFQPLDAPLLRFQRPGLLEKLVDHDAQVLPVEIVGDL